MLLQINFFGSNELQTFWSGVWDGMTILFAFVGKLFGGNYSIYEIHNNGSWYDFGFIIGFSIHFSLGWVLAIPLIFIKGFLSLVKLIVNGAFPRSK